MKKATILSTLEEILEKYRYVNDSTDGGRVGAFKRFRKTLDEQGIQDLENILLSWLREASSGSRRNRLSVVFLEGECSEYGKKKLLEILKKNNWKNYSRRDILQILLSSSEYGPDIESGLNGFASSGATDAAFLLPLGLRMENPPIPKLAEMISRWWANASPVNKNRLVVPLLGSTLRLNRKEMKELFEGLWMHSPEMTNTLFSMLRNELGKSWNISIYGARSCGEFLEEINQF